MQFLGRRYSTREIDRKTEHKSISENEKNERSVMSLTGIQGNGKNPRTLGCSYLV